MLVSDPSHAQYRIPPFACQAPTMISSRSIHCLVGHSHIQYCPYMPSRRSPIAQQVPLLPSRFLYCLVGPSIDRQVPPLPSRFLHCLVGPSIAQQVPLLPSISIAWQVPPLPSSRSLHCLICPPITGSMPSNISLPCFVSDHAIPSSRSSCLAGPSCAQYVLTCPYCLVGPYHPQQQLHLLPSRSLPPLVVAPSIAQQVLNTPNSSSIYCLEGPYHPQQQLYLLSYLSNRSLQNVHIVYIFTTPDNSFTYCLVGLYIISLLPSRSLSSLIAAPSIAQQVLTEYPYCLGPYHPKQHLIYCLVGPYYSEQQLHLLPSRSLQNIPIAQVLTTPSSISSIDQQVLTILSSSSIYCLAGPYRISILPRSLPPQVASHLLTSRSLLF